MKYEWRFGTAVVSEEQLAKFTLKNAHQFYAKADRFSVREPDGYVGRGGSESVYREDAFQTASDYYGVGYHLFYDAWLNGEPLTLTT